MMLGEKVLNFMFYFNTIDKISFINMNNMIRHAKRDHIPKFFRQNLGTSLYLSHAFKFITKILSIYPINFNYTLKTQLFEHIRT